MKRLPILSFIFICVFLLIKSLFVSESTEVTKTIDTIHTGVTKTPTVKTKPKLKLIESYEFSSEQITDLAPGQADSSMGQSYRELIEVDVANRKNVTINFTETIDDVISVVIAGVSGQLLPSSIKINNGQEKSRYHGQELFEDDWIKIDDFKGKLSSINLDLIAKESGSLKIYIQKRSNQ